MNIIKIILIILFIIISIFNYCSLVIAKRSDKEYEKNIENKDDLY